MFSSALTTATLRYAERLNGSEGNCHFGHRKRAVMRLLISNGKTVGVHCFE